MKQRILVAVVGIPALLAVLCIAPAWATALLLAALSVIAAHELLTAVSGPDKARRWTVLPALCGVLLLEPLFSGGKIMFHAHGGTLPSASMNVRISFHDYSIACARVQPSLDEWGRLCYNFREERRAP